MRSRPPFACIALLIQGGGALGACQAGVYEALAENVVHLIYRAKNYEGPWKDYDFSLTSMQERWCAGYHDAVRTLRYPRVLERPTSHKGVFTFDLLHDGRE
jgi:hypothetical protein